MPRIGVSLSGIERTLLNRLNEANSAAALHSLRLATGRKVNRPADDPARFVELSGLRSRQNTVTATLANVSAASEVVATTQLALDNIRTQLNTIRTLALADEDQQLTAEQRAANQAAIDAAIDEIEKLAGTQSAAGKSLLDGSSDFDISGRNASQISDVTVHRLAPGATTTIDVEVTTAATQAVLTYTGTSGQVTNEAQFTLSGDRGSATIDVSGGENLTDVRDRINLESHHTGVVASVSGDDLTLTSIEFGTDATTGVAVLSGTFTVTGGTNGVATGTDGVATINGQSVTGRGNRFTVSDNSLTFTLETAAGFTGTADTVTISAGGSLSFALSPELAHSSTLGLTSVAPHRLGGLSGTLDQLRTGEAAGDLGTNAPLAVRIADEALADLTRLEGTVDGFADAAIASSNTLLTELEEELQTTIDVLDKVDENEEALLRDKALELVDNSVAGLAVLANTRSSVLEIIRQIAGLS